MPEQSSTTQEQNKKTDNKDVEQNKTIAMLSYLWILFLIPLLTAKESKFAQFHAKQGLVLFIISLATPFPVLGQILGLVLTVVCIIGIIKTLNGEWWKIPVVYDLSKKFNL